MREGLHIGCHLLVSCVVVLVILHRLRFEGASDQLLWSHRINARGTMLAEFNVRLQPLRWHVVVT